MRKSAKWGAGGGLAGAVTVLAAALKVGPLVIVGAVAGVFCALMLLVSLYTESEDDRVEKIKNRFFHKREHEKTRDDGLRGLAAKIGEAKPLAPEIDELVQGPRYVGIRPMADIGISVEYHDAGHRVTKGGGSIDIEVTDLCVTNQTDQDMSLSFTAYWKPIRKDREDGKERRKIPYPSVGKDKVLLKARQFHRELRLVFRPCQEDLEYLGGIDAANASWKTVEIRDAARNNLLLWEVPIGPMPTPFARHRNEPS